MGYLGRTVGSPPGLPGGGITGVLPTSGVGARISGSTPAGGHSTPSDLASLSPSGCWVCPVVAPGAVVPGGLTVACGEHSVADGAVVVGGLGGAWAAAGTAARAKQPNAMVSFDIMPGQRGEARHVPAARGHSLR